MTNIFYIVTYILVPKKSFTCIFKEGYSMKFVIEAGAMLLDTLENQDKEIVHIQYDIVTRNTPATTYRWLYSRWTYTIIGFADPRVKDMDIEVYKLVDTMWIPIANDTLRNKLPMVEITPGSAALYKIIVSAYEFIEPFVAAHYGLIVYHVKPD